MTFILQGVRRDGLLKRLGKGCVNLRGFSVCRLECQVIILTLAAFKFKYHKNSFLKREELALI